MVFFYGYVYEGYYENNADRCFTYLSGYKDNTLCSLRLLMTHFETRYCKFLVVDS